MAKKPRRSAFESDYFNDMLDDIQPTTKPTIKSPTRPTRRQKLTFDLRHPASLDRLAELTTSEGISKSDVMEFALALLHQMWHQKRLNLEPLKEDVPYQNQAWRSRTVLHIPDEIELSK